MSTPQRPLRAGIIGLSWIGANHAGPASLPILGSAPPYSHASAFAAIGGIEVVGACDLSAEARDGFVDKWGEQWPDMQLFDDAAEMLQLDLDLVSIVVPDHLHGRLLIQCLDAGVPMIFAEKPFTTDLDEADEVLRAIDASGATVAINHTWRWRPEIIETLAMVQAGALGPVSHISVEAGGPRAMLFRNLSHFLDLAVYLSDSEPVWVAAELEEGARDYGLTYRGDGGRDAALDPGALAWIGLANGARAYVSALKSSTADVVVSVSCREGRVLIDALGAKIIEARRGTDGTPDSVSKPVVSALTPRFSMSGMRAGLEDLIASHHAGVEPSGSARSARNTVAVIEAALRSQASGNARVDVRQADVSKGVSA